MNLIHAASSMPPDSRAENCQQSGQTRLLQATSESSTVDGVLDGIERTTGLPFKRANPMEQWSNALLGFKVLNDRGSAAIPELERMLTDPALVRTPTYAQNATIALHYLGTNAVAALVQKHGCGSFYYPDEW